jgi:UTP--glucose-1-phosphate uridylyltransferase
MGRQVRKVVIPAAGLGTRFLPATKAQAKEMVPIVDKPAIQYVVEEAVAAGITDILVVTGRGKRAIEDHFDRSLELEEALERAGKADQLAEIRAVASLAEVFFVRQPVPLGLGHAVAMARAHIGDEPFAVMLPDDLIHERAGVLAGMIEAHERTGSSVLALKAVAGEEISMYGCAAVRPLGDSLVEVTDVVEKPALRDAPSNLAVMGRYVLTPAIFDAIDATPAGRGSEVQLTDAIRLLMQSETVAGYCFDWGRFDVGNKLDYLKATVEMAMEREDLGPAFRTWLESRLGVDGVDKVKKEVAGR